MTIAILYNIILYYVCTVTPGDNGCTNLVVIHHNYASSAYIYMYKP